ncbi:Beta-lactamase [Streptomyces sp. ADI93-02]|nr:Beta-lactamase [Streptomyces sp. ADI93-02]
MSTPAPPGPWEARRARPTRLGRRPELGRRSTRRQRSVGPRLGDEARGRNRGHGTRRERSTRSRRHRRHAPTGLPPGRQVGHHSTSAAHAHVRSTRAGPPIPGPSDSRIPPGGRPSTASHCEAGDPGPVLVAGLHHPGAPGRDCGRPSPRCPGDTIGLCAARNAQHPLLPGPGARQAGGGHRGLPLAQPCGRGRGPRQERGCARRGRRARRSVLHARGHGTARCRARRRRPRPVEARHFPLRRALGWQNQDPVGSPAGTSFGRKSYGHTGFTGTSLWVDPETQRYAALLTNPVHPVRGGDGITGVRAAFHELAAATPARLRAD